MYVFLKLEKLLQKNYNLYQVAREGYRAYLQAYASYSLKQIYDVNKLDLVKVGKSFGFPVPPRVNLKVGGGQGGAGRTGGGKKRRRDEDGDGEEKEGEDEKEEVWEEIDAVDKTEEDLREGGEEEDQEDSRRVKSRSGGRDRRKEVLGKKKIEKEKFRKGMERKRARTSGGPQWSR